MPWLHRAANWECILFLAAHEKLSCALDVLGRDVGDVHLPLDAVEGEDAPLDPGEGSFLKAISALT